MDTEGGTTLWQRYMYMYIHVLMYMKITCIDVKIGEYVSTQTLVDHQWAGPSVIAHLAPDSMPDKAE